MRISCVLISTVLISGLPTAALATGGTSCGPGYAHVGGTCISTPSVAGKPSICKPVGGICVKLTSPLKSPGVTYYCNDRDRRSCIRVVA